MPLPAADGHERVVALQGTQNTRDIGGYVNADGNSVLWGRIMRSDNLARLTAADIEQLEAMGLRTVIDLRTTAETREAPTAWQGPDAPNLLHIPIGDEGDAWFGRQARMLRSGRFNLDGSLGHFIDGYRSVPVAAFGQFEALMDVVQDESRWPLLIHCSAGKDRTGIAVALILEAIGVERSVILQDYLLTNEVARTQQQAEILAREQKNRAAPRTGSRIGATRTPSAEAYFPFVGVLPEMLEGFYEGVNEGFGGMDEYLRRMGLDSRAREALKRSLTGAGG